MKKLPFSPEIVTGDGGPVVTQLSEMFTQMVQHGFVFDEEYIVTYKVILERAAMQHFAETELGGEVAQDYRFPPQVGQKDDFGFVLDAQQVANTITYVWRDRLRSVDIVLLNPTLVLGKQEFWAFNGIPLRNYLEEVHCATVTIPMGEFFRARTPNGQLRFKNTGRMVNDGPQLA